MNTHFVWGTTIGVDRLLSWEQVYLPWNDDLCFLRVSLFSFKSMVYSLPKMFSVSLSCFQLFADFTFSWSAFCHPGASVECWNAAGSHISSAAHRAASPCEFPGQQNFGSCVPWTVSLHILNIKYQYHYLKQCQKKNLRNLSFTNMVGQ